MSSYIHNPTPQISTGLSFDELARTNHGNSSTSTRNRRPVERRQRQERRPPVYARTETRNPSSNTQTAKLFLTKRAGGKRKKGKTQKKRKSTKKRNKKKKQ
jgi:hypothetical protein